MIKDRGNRVIRKIYLDDKTYELLRKKAKEKGTTIAKEAERMIREGTTAKDR